MCKSSAVSKQLILGSKIAGLAQWTLLILLGLSPILGASQIINMEAKRLQGTEEGWAGSADVYFNYLQNTRKLITFGARLHTGQLKKKRRLLFLGDVSLSRADQSDLVNKGYLHARYNYEWSKTITPEVFGQAQYNSVQRIDLRTLLGAGPRFRIHDNDTLEAYFGTLYMYEYENIGDSTAYLTAHRSSSYLSLNYFVSDIFSISNITYYQPSLVDFADFRVSTETSLNIYLNKRFTIRILYSLLYDSRQVEGLPNQYHTFKNSLGIRF